MSPVRIKVDDRALIIGWNDKTESFIKLANLRSQCPCAVCASEKAEQSDSYIPIYTNQELSVKNIKPIGNYAITIEWADEHNTGIYDYSFLKQLSEKIVN